MSDPNLKSTSSKNNKDDNLPPNVVNGKPLRFDIQEYINLSEDEIVDYDTSEEFLLHFSRIGQLNFVQKLLNLRDNKSIDLDINCKGASKSNLGWTPLHLAAYFGHIEVVESLLNAGAEVDVQNEEGDTPLHRAAYTGRDRIVVLLISHNANVFLPNGDGLRPFELAKTETIRQILSAAEKADIKRRETRFLSAARNSDIATMKKLLEDSINPVNINCVDSSGNTALHCAAYRGKQEAVVFLLKNQIDTAVKNNREQLAANVASTISLKQLIQEVHLSVMSPQMIASLKNRTIKRFEGLLLKKGRFFGWKLIWAVLERGVFSFFTNRADAANGIRRKGYKYLESAITERVNNCTNDEHMFIIIFGDRSRALFQLPKSQTELDLQKWLNAINDHIYFGTNFIKQGTRLIDSDDEDDAAKILPMSSIHDMILTATAHQKILEKHIGGLQLLVDDESLFTVTADDAVIIAETSSMKSFGQHSNSTISNSTIPSVKFHLNLILESSRNANQSLVQCLTVISHQNEARQSVIRQEQEKVRVLEEALQILAREHHELERSIITNSTQTIHDANNHINGPSSMAASVKLSNSIMENYGHQMSSRARSIACLSDSTNTDLEEFYDAFDDEDDLALTDTDVIDVSNVVVGVGGGGGGPTYDKISLSRDSSQFTNDVLVDGILPASMKSPINENNNTTQFHTAQSDVTINDSISTLSPDTDSDPTLESFEMDGHIRDRLPAPMVPRDEVGLWSILKHCIGKELSKITIPVVFNEPLSFLQRMAEVFEYADFLDIADQCDNVVERMENVCAFIISAYSSNWLRLNKPFNPLLGETFELEIPGKETRIVLEQVSHHPPITAWYAESPHFVIRGSIHPKLRFWGKSIEVKPEGSITLELKSKGETYTWKSINCCVHNIIVGKLWFEQYGNIEVINHSNKYRIMLNFKQAGWFGYDLNRFDGFILNDRKEKIRFLYGKWNDYLKSSSIEDYDEYLRLNQKFRAPDKPADDPMHQNHGSSTPRKMISKLNSLTKQLTGNSSDPVAVDDLSKLDDQMTTTNCEIPKSDSSHSLDISNSRILWKVQPRPEHSGQYYHFNAFAFMLNQLPDEKQLSSFPITDSRFRPDIRKLEEGDLDGAASEKHRLEEKQREARRLSKKSKEKDTDPLWFHKQLNKTTNEEEWYFNEDYWKRNWSRCPDIF